MRSRPLCDGEPEVSVLALLAASPPCSSPTWRRQAVLHAGHVCAAVPRRRIVSPRVLPGDLHPKAFALSSGAAAVTTVAPLAVATMSGCLAARRRGPSLVVVEDGRIHFAVGFKACATFTASRRLVKRRVRRSVAVRASVGRVAATVALTRASSAASASASAGAASAAAAASSPSSAGSVGRWSAPDALSCRALSRATA